MKTWKNKAGIPVFGICTVKEASDRECQKSKRNLAPISHGFVNLFKNRKFVAWCGYSYAEEHLLKNEK